MAGTRGKSSGTPPQLVLQPLLAVVEIAEATGFHERSVRRWIAAGELRAIRIGGKLRVRPADLLDFLQENEV